MPEGGFYSEKRASPISLAIVITLHAAAVTALALSKMDFEVIGRADPTKVVFIDEPKDPPPLPDPPEPKREVRQKTVIDQVPVKINIERQSEFTPDRAKGFIPAFDPNPSGSELAKPVDPPLPPLPLPDPVRIEAQIDPRSEMQPPYPASEQRAEREGTVTVRLLIGSDGRVKDVQKVRATSDAFFRATEQHARRSWRFRPATVDSRPVESRKSMTVHFRLEA